MAHIFANFLGGREMMGLWYHFAILFEALFILTTVDAGTRVARFMLQDMVGAVIPSFKETKNWGNNLVGSALAVGAWGYFLYAGVTDPLGGINTLWPLFGISNQMLAGIALIMCTVIMIKMKRERFAWVPAIPAAWLLICTLIAGWQKVFSSDVKVGFAAHARKFGDALAQGQIIAPAKDLNQMSKIVFNDWVDTTLSVVFVVLVVAMLYYGVVNGWQAYRNGKVTTHEVGDDYATHPVAGTAVHG